MRKAVIFTLVVLATFALWPPLPTPAKTPDGSTLVQSPGPSAAAATNISRNSGSSQHPALATDNFGNLHFAWQDDSDTPGKFDIFYRRWNGSPWSLTTPPTKLLQNPGLSDTPSLVADSLGRVHVVWEDDSEGNFDILYQNWSGTSWSPNENITRNSGASYTPKVGIDGSGIVYVVWSDNTPGNFDILYRTWNGTAWSSPLNLTQNTGASISPAIAVSSTGSVHVVWADNTSGNYEVLYRRWTGSAWSNIENLSQNTGASTNPAIAINAAGNIAVAWQDDTPLNSDIFYRGWNGAVWSDIQNLSGNVSASTTPSVAVDNTGKVHVVWSDNSPGNDQIFYRNWNGAAWSDSENLSQTTGGAYTPVIAVDSLTPPNGPNVHVAWADNTLGNYEIFYVSATAPPAAVPTATPEPTAVPATNQIQLSAGWNLISVRVALLTPAIANVFTQTPAVTKLFYFQDGAWSYAFRGPEGWGGTLQQVDDGKGYWAFATAPATLILQPDPQAKPAAYPLPAGWSLIGYSSIVASRSVDAYLNSLQGKWTNLYRYDATKGWELAKPSGSGFAGFVEVTQGRGYWVYLSEAGTLTPP
ncbi:MAG: hypothetical protein HYX92_01735 [Chloroflexi bacterium]|nr:hypothetical protein [Chloroflexota bacterium]